MHWDENKPRGINIFIFNQKPIEIHITSGIINLSGGFFLTYMGRKSDDRTKYIPKQW